MLVSYLELCLVSGSNIFIFHSAASEDTSVGDFLTSLGHQTQVVSNIGSCVNAAAKINETVRAFGDRRNGGGESVF